MISQTEIETLLKSLCCNQLVEGDTEGAARDNRSNPVELRYADAIGAIHDLGRRSRLEDLEDATGDSDRRPGDD